MRSWLAVGAFIGIAFAASPLAGQQTTNFTLRRGYAGDLRIGMTVAAVIALYGQQRVKTVDLYTENPDPEPALEIRLRGLTAPKASLVATLWPFDADAPANKKTPLAKKTVYGISVHDRRFRTVDGLGMGSTLREIRARHAVQIGTGEGSLGASADDLGLTFDFSQFYPWVNVPARGRAQSVGVWAPPSDSAPARR